MEEPNHVLGRRSMYTCPECGGVLAESEEGPALWFKCHVGHSYSPDSLVAEQTRSLESALWAAYRALEERSSLSRRMAERSKRLGHETMRARHLAEAERARRHADTIRRLLDSPPGVASGTDEATGEQGPEIGNA
jgi:two-component system chemotaxis response regulator CheB